MMSKEEQDLYVKPMDQFDEKELIKIDIRGNEILDLHKISLEVLRKIEDKKYEVNIKYE